MNIAAITQNSGYIAEILYSVLSLLFCGLSYYLVSKYIISKLPHKKRQSAYLLTSMLSILLLVSLLFIWSPRIESLKDFSTTFANKDMLENFFWTAVVILFIYFLSTVLEQSLIRKSETVVLAHKIRRATNWGKTILILFIISLIWTRDLENVSVLLGIIGAGLALSMQEILLCIAGWLHIVFKKPYDVGDRVEIANKCGDVIDISVLHTALLEVGNWVEADQSTGRIINIPNSNLFRSEIANYTKGFPFIWNELTTVVTFESDWKRAKEIILKQAQEEAGKIENEVRQQIKAMQTSYAIRYERLLPIVYSSIAENGVALTLRYLSPVRNRRGTSHKISEAILEEFLAEETVDFAYPSTRFFFNPKEGKPGTGGQREQSGPPDDVLKI